MSFPAMPAEGEYPYTSKLHAWGAAVESNMAVATVGKNLYDPAADDVEVGRALDGGTGTTVALANYTVTGYIPVKPGDPYALNGPRTVAFYDANHDYLGYPTPGWIDHAAQSVLTVTPPANTAYLRATYNHVNKPNFQVEKGSTATPYEAFRRELDPAVAVPSAGPLLVERTGDALTVRSSTAIGEISLAAVLTDDLGRNGVFNFRTASLNLVALSPCWDDVAPIRTTQGTVGANHGFPQVGRWTAANHNKTAADLGSVWTDGVNEYVILAITGGDLYVARKPTTAATGESVAEPVTLAADLTHVSGATNTAPIPAASRLTGQLYPWIQRRRVAALIDGATLPNGTTRGRELIVRESYEVLDIGVVYPWAKANVGTSYTTAHHEAAVAIDTEWRFRPGGKLRGTYALREIRPTRLGACGFFQAGAITGSLTRYLPGVAPIAGLAWDSGVPLANLTADQIVYPANLQKPGQPPTTLVDVRADVAMAVAVDPWEGASANTTRMANSPTNLWDLRATKKVYPTVLGAAAPGWGRLTVAGIRAYLTPAEAAAIVTDADPLSAWSTLDQLV